MNKFLDNEVTRIAAILLFCMVMAGTVSAWDVTSANYVQSKNVSTEDTHPEEVFFKDDGTQMYVMGVGNNNVYEYSLGTAWDVTSATTNLSTTLPPLQQTPSCNGIQKCYYPDLGFPASLLCVEEKKQRKKRPFTVTPEKLFEEGGDCQALSHARKCLCDLHNKTCKRETIIRTFKKGNSPEEVTKDICFLNKCMAWHQRTELKTEEGWQPINEWLIEEGWLNG